MITICCDCNSLTSSFEAKDWITIFSVIAIIAGWFVNGALNRRNEIAQKRLEHRLPTLKAFLNVFFFVQKNSTPFADPTFLPMIEEVRENFQLYGKDDEIALYEAFIKCIETKDVNGANEVLNKLVLLIRDRIRSELNIKK